VKFSEFVGYVHLTKNYALKLEHFCYTSDQTREKPPLAGCLPTFAS